jgi:mono/diheme cytochrome c family protein
VEEFFMRAFPCAAACAAAVTLGTATWLQAAGAGQKPQAPAIATAASQRALVDRYCVTCHNQRLKTGGLALDTLDMANVATAAPAWEKVVRKLRAGVMPPVGLPRPDRDAHGSFVRWLEARLDAASAANPDPGRTETFHRLNRAEYRNAIRDLLGLELDVASLLPADDASYGFDNIAGVLRMSPTLLDRYLAAAQKVSRVAIGTSASSAVAETFRVAPDLSQDGHIEGLPFGTRGGILVRFTFPQDGEYVISARLARDTEDNIPRFDEPHDLEVMVDGERVHVFTLPGDPLTASIRDPNVLGRVRQDLDAKLQARVAVKAGPREVGLAFLKKPSAQVDTLYPGAFSPRVLALKQPFQRPYAGGFGNDDHRFQPYLASVTIGGPYNSRPAVDTPSRRRIFTCRPVRPSDEARCADGILRSLARRAYRRPVADADLKPLLAFYEEGRTDGFEAGIELAVQRLLMSPEFLFRVERDAKGVAPGRAYRISDLELASRLSFFFWSSGPDDELLEQASRGRLSRPEVLEQQVRRLLADPRSEAFVTNFTGQWLYLRNLPAVSPDPNLFPDFDEGLRLAFRREVELFFDSLVREDRSALDLLTADYTFVNERLARHYGIPEVKGSHFRRVALTEDTRRGLLGKGSILASTSYPHRTSPVLRGKWILENLLGSAPPPPPPDVPDLKDTNAEGRVLSMRERMVQHRANAVCASCHATMDPLGLSLENFDAVGRWRTRGESFAPIDASGVLPDGTAFDGVTGLRQALLDRSELFVTTLTEKLLVYALGRGLEHYDAPAVRAITRHAARNEYRFSALLMGIVQSTPFQMRRAAE